MSRLWKVSLSVLALIAFCAGEEEPTPAAAEKADELSKDEIYNINADMYCQTELAINEKLLDIEGPVNLYTSILGEDIKDIDCEAVLREYVIRVHKRLSKDFRSKGASYKTVNCYMSKIDELGYDKMRFRFNALYGIEIEKEKKTELRNAIDKEIGDVVEQAVEACWPKDTKSSNETESAENTNNL